MKKSFTVKFPVKQAISSGMSWAQINELSWVEVNLLSWRDLIVLFKRYIDYSVTISKKYVKNIKIELKKSFSVR